MKFIVERKKRRQYSVVLLTEIDLAIYSFESNIEMYKTSVYDF